MSRKKTTDEFILQAIEKHGTRYDYKKTKYVNAVTDVVITCREHGDFYMRPNNHLKGDGCPICRYIIDKKVCGVGDNDLHDINENDVAYQTWRDMLKRCYDRDYKRSSSYIDCTVCEQWHKYSAFLSWFDANYIDGWQLDKDILEDGNREYSPNKCCFVPKEINIIFTSHLNHERELPLGVSFIPRLNKYRADVSIDGKSTYLGLYSDVNNAFLAYKKAKESYIKTLAERYKDKLNNNVYKTLINYEIKM